MGVPAGARPTLVHQSVRAVHLAGKRVVVTAAGRASRSIYSFISLPSGKMDRPGAAAADQGPCDPGQRRPHARTTGRSARDTANDAGRAGRSCRAPIS
jgi:hypothetical protein